MRLIASIATLTLLGTLGLLSVVGLAGSQTSNDLLVSCQQSRAEALLAGRIINRNNSYSSDARIEAPKVLGYLRGGVRPPDSQVTTHMGKHLVAGEDVCRGLDIQPPPTTTTTTSPPPPTDDVTYLSPLAGATVTGTVAVRVTAPAETDWIGVWACGGESVGEDHVADGNEWSVLWDTTSIPECTNGTQGLDTWAFRDDGSNLGNSFITVAVANDTPPPPPPPPPPDISCDSAGDPGPISGLGYTVRFQDCFTILDRSTWCSHQWWEPNPVPGSQTVSDGELRLRRARADGYVDTTVSTEPCGQANPKSFQYGYFEARMKHETAQGNGPAFWLFSTAHAENGDGTPPDNWPNPACPNPLCLSAELDVFEGFGTINYGGSRTDDFFSGTIHRNSCECYGVANSSRFVQRGTGLDMSQYHVYAARWTPTTVFFYIDGQLQGSVASYDSFAQPMHLLLYNWTTDWEDENIPNGSTQAELDVFVDWVRVWQQ